MSPHRGAIYIVTNANCYGAAADAAIRGYIAQKSERAPAMMSGALEDGYCYAPRCHALRALERKSEEFERRELRDDDVRALRCCYSVVKN